MFSLLDNLHIDICVGLSPLWRLFADLAWVASTGLAFEPPLLVLGGPTVVLGLGETSCPACEEPLPAAGTQTQTLSAQSFPTGQVTESFPAVLLAAAGSGGDCEAEGWLLGLRGEEWDPEAAPGHSAPSDWAELH